MAFFFTENAGSTESDLDIKSGPHDLVAGLPAEHSIHVFSNRERLQAEAHEVLNALARNQWDGNQYILVLGISKSVIDKLDNDKDFLGGIDYRFQWEGTAGLIRIIPSAPHEQINSDFTVLVGEQLAGMGVHRSERRWGLATTYRPSAGTGNKGKQGDQIFLPTPRQPVGSQVVDWPTLVLEIGVSESKPKLEEDTKWWFNNSNGRVRIVLLVLVRKQKLVFEKWQLLPPGAPANATRLYLASLRQQPPHMPPLGVQAAANQRCYSAQEVTVDRNGVAGAPMFLPFRALFDRNPGPGESDVMITAQDFQEITATVL